MKPINEKGVTLIELVVVFVIIAILSVLMVPNIGTWLPRYRLKSATRDVVSTLRMAQMRAVSTNMQYGVDFNVAGNFYNVQYRTTSGTGPWLNEGATQNLPTGITFKSAVFGGGSQAVFNPNSSSSGGSVTLQNEKKKIQRSITVNPATGKTNTLD